MIDAPEMRTSEDVSRMRHVFYIDGRWGGFSNRLQRDIHDPAYCGRLVKRFWESLTHRQKQHLITIYVKLRLES